MVNLRLAVCLMALFLMITLVTETLSTPNSHRGIGYGRPVYGGHSPVHYGYYRPQPYYHYG